jgi:hypothetical protein
LGNVVSKGLLKPKPDRAKCIATKEKPSTLKGLLGWLGAANYLRRYIPNYAQVTQPLYNLVDQKKILKSLRKKNGAPDGRKIALVWTDLAIEHFAKLQQILCSELVLALPDFSKDMNVTTDASELGYGGQLEQNFKIEESDLDDIRPIEYFSKNYTVAQKKYSTTEKEMLAVVMTVENFHLYLYGRKFTIYTDHLPLTWIWTKKNPHPRIERWMMRMALYEFTVVYKPGKDNHLADFLS